MIMVPSRDRRERELRSRAPSRERSRGNRAGTGNQNFSKNRERAGTGNQNFQKIGNGREPGTKNFKNREPGGNREPKILKNRERAGTGNRLNDIRLNGQTDRVTKFSSTFRPTEHISAKLSGQRDSRRRNWIRKCVNFNSLNSHIK